MSSIDTDVLVVGAGAAGLITALNAQKRRVCIMCPDTLEFAGTASDLAQGGIAAAVGAEDTPLLHLNDTLLAGQGCNALPAARLLCQEAPAAIAYLRSLGVAFARDANGWELHKEAAHSCARVLHVGGDATGAGLMLALRRHITAAAHIELMPRTRAVGLLADRRGVHGITAITDPGSVLTVRSRAVVIATGGIGGLFSRSTNPAGACGDGLGMALAAGARSADLEFVQFHPTALDVDAHPLPLLTEALRGAGARLVDEAGVGIMSELHPLGDLAPRDVVARAIYAIQAKGGRVWLDATRLANGDVRELFPSVHSACRSHGLDLAHEPVPVTPAAHYHMGGIAVDLEGYASLPHLWAVGEAACTGVHGCNRLASNSLLEAVVFGRRVGQSLNRMHGELLPGRFFPTPQWIQLPTVSSQRELRAVMWRCMGVVRCARELAEGLAFVSRLRDQTSPHATLTRARLLLAEHMLLAAARRLSNRGAHFRSDALPRDMACGTSSHRVYPIPRRRPRAAGRSAVL